MRTGRIAISEIIVTHFWPCSV